MVDGNLWASGGAGAGKSKLFCGKSARRAPLSIDMIPVYALENFPKGLVRDMSMDILGLDPEARGQFYKGSNPHAPTEDLFLFNFRSSVGALATEDC